LSPHELDLNASPLNYVSFPEYPIVCLFIATFQNVGLATTQLKDLPTMLTQKARH